MFGPPGMAYVYLVYGMYDCLNVVTEVDGRAGAVLIRAVEPIEGTGAMRDAVASLRASRRKAGATGAGGSSPGGRPPPDERVAAGPGLVAAAFSIDRRHTGTDLCDGSSSLRLELPAAGDRPVELAATPRIGVAYAGEPWASVPWRLVDATSASLSRRLARLTQTTGR